MLSRSACGGASPPSCPDLCLLYHDQTCYLNVQGETWNAALLSKTGSVINIHECWRWASIAPGLTCKEAQNFGVLMHGRSLTVTQSIVHAPRSTLSDDKSCARVGFLHVRTGAIQISVTFLIKAGRGRRRRRRRRSRGRGCCKRSKRFETF